VQTADFGLAVACDGKGNVYNAGDYYGDSVAFGNFVMPGVRTASYGIFIAKYDSAGNVLWAKSAIGGRTNNLSIGLATDVNGDAYITGDYFSDSIKFGSTTLFHAADGTDDIFIAKYDALGNVLWAKSSVTYNSFAVEGAAVTTDLGGNAYITGGFLTDSITFNGHSLQGPDGWHSYLVKYDSIGNVLWAKRPISGHDFGNGVATYGNNEVYVTGNFEEDSLSVDSFNYTHYGTGNFYLAKYDALGNPIWMKHATECLSSVGYGVATDASDDVFVCGGVLGDSIRIDATHMPMRHNATDPMLVLKLDGNGNILCSEAIPSGGDDRSGICADRTGNASIVGDYETDAFILGNDTLLPTGGETGFAAKFNCSLKSDIQRVDDFALLRVYPNPFEGTGTVQYSLPGTFQNAQLVIYDVLGKQKASYKLTYTESEIRIGSAGFSAGIYICSIVVDGKVLASRKMIVE
ncbi:MAG: hypothetical protein JWO06_3918, partial [Bacteroidota bacterium]|nr:hypothetical protein [Bacteroidota bacterium]